MICKTEKLYTQENLQETEDI